MLADLTYAHLVFKSGDYFLDLMRTTEVGRKMMHNGKKNKKKIRSHTISVTNSVFVSAGSTLIVLIFSLQLLTKIKA